MTDPGSLGRRIRARRLSLGLTLAEAADRADLSLPYLSNLERGRGNPTIEALRSIAAALDTTLTALVGDDGAPDVDPLELVLSDAPRSLMAFSKTDRFVDAVARIAARQGVDAATMRSRLLASMASAPRRSSGDPTEEDWRRLLDVYALITAED